MESSAVITNDEIRLAISKSHFTGRSVDECRLCLAELIVKASAGYYNSHTEEAFLLACGVMKRDRTPNRKGRRFLMRMLYASSNKKAECFGLIGKYRYD